MDEALRTVPAVPVEARPENPLDGMGIHILKSEMFGISQNGGFGRVDFWDRDPEPVEKPPKQPARVHHRAVRRGPAGPAPEPVPRVAPPGSLRDQSPTRTAPLVRELYSREPFRIETVSAPRNVIAKGSGRGPVTELLITNYRREEDAGN